MTAAGPDQPHQCDQRCRSGQVSSGILITTSVRSADSSPASIAWSISSEEVSKRGSASPAQVSSTNWAHRRVPGISRGGVEGIRLEAQSPSGRTRW